MASRARRRTGGGGPPLSPPKSQFAAGMMRTSPLRTSPLTAAAPVRTGAPAALRSDRKASARVQATSKRAAAPAAVSTGVAALLRLTGTGLVAAPVNMRDAKHSYRRAAQPQPQTAVMAKEDHDDDDERGGFELRPMPAQVAVWAVPPQSLSSDPAVRAWLSAARAGDLDALRALQGHRQSDLLTACDPADSTGSALHIAARAGRCAVVRWLVEDCRVPIDLRAPRTGCTALQLAAFHGSRLCVRFCLKAGADLHARNGGGWTAVYGACQNGHLDIAEALCKAGADLNVVDADGWPPLFQAIAATADVGVARWLLRRQCASHWLSHRDAERKGWVDLVRKLSGRRQYEMLEVLLSFGADRYAPDQWAGFVVPPMGQPYVDLGRKTFATALAVRSGQLRTVLEPCGVLKELVVIIADYSLL
jgi:hypothetical protein